MNSETFNDLNLEHRESRRHGGHWLWPKEDVWGWKWLNKIGHWDLPIQIEKFCKSKNTVIQAGGNAGLYAKQYSKIFNSVITFEPDYRNFVCLCENVKESNVTKYQKALGECQQRVQLDYNPKWKETNSGALKITGEGQIEQVSIDSLCLNPDLIHLDIEGYEGFALLGARETIIRCRPLIVLETNDSGDNYGWPQYKIDSLLMSLGYEVYKKWEHDTVYQFVE